MIAAELAARFGTIDGELAVGGLPLRRLAAQVGSTPFFAYDRAQLTERVRELRKALPARLELTYAIKANPMPAVVQHLAGLVDSIDVASALEMLVALDTPLPADRISFAGPGKTAPEIRQAVAAGVTLELESATEARRAIAAGEELGLTPRVAIRVNPDFAVKGSGMRMGGGAQQFGVDSEQVPELLRELDGTGIDVLGFHVFAGSQNLRADTLIESQRRTVDLVLGLADLLPTEMRYLNLGGGFGIPYFARDAPLDLNAVADNLHDLVDGIIADRLPDCEDRHRTGPLPGRGVRRLRHRGRRPQGLTGPDLFGGRRRDAPPVRRRRAFRAGHPTELPRARRQPRR